MAVTSSDSRQDERLVQSGWLKRLLTRPEFGALAGAILVWLFFAIVAPVGFLSLRGTASYLEVSAHIGILAVAVALLMIGGEFDLSVGSVIGFAGACMAILSTVYGVPLYIAAIIALALALLVGFVNGYVVIRTGLPSFIITLSSLFIVRGLTIALTRLITGRTQIGSIDKVPGYAPMYALFGIDIPIAGVGFPISIVWWLALVALATWILVNTRTGNWIFGAGGAPLAARNVGVPVDRLKIGLFMTTAAAAWLVASIQITVVKSADTLRGEQQEFITIIAAVIGGNLLTGGYGSAIGAALGALIFGMVRQGIVYAGIDADWYNVFLGVMLIVAVLVNSYVRKLAEKGAAMTTNPATAPLVTAPLRTTPLIEVSNISKFFGSVIALQDVSMTVYAGEVLCLLGDNGAGKSTLIKILSGVHKPNEGDYFVDGKRVVFDSPCDALALGIATVYQDLAMIPLMSIERNFFLGSEPTVGRGPFRRFDHEFATRVAQEELSKMGIDIRDPSQPVGTLSGGERQSVAIARAVYFGAKVLILDEPTAALGVKQASVVLRYVAQSRARGLGVVFITHNPHHAYAVGDRFTVLKRGHSAGTFTKGEISREEVVRLMSGADELDEISQELQLLSQSDTQQSEAQQTKVPLSAVEEQIAESLAKDQESFKQENFNDDMPTP